MTTSSLGDLARSFALRNHQTKLKLDIQERNQELATGMTANLPKHLGGSYARLTAIERDIRLTEGYEVTIGEATQFTELMQVRLEQISKLSSDFSNGLVIAGLTTADSSIESLSTEGKSQFASVVSMLNSQSAGRSMFAGDTTDKPALVDPDTFMTALEGVVSGATTSADIDTALDAWFASPTGFAQVAYTGSTTDIAPFHVSDTAQVDAGIRADNEVLKEIMKTLAKTALVTSSTVSLSNEEKRQALEEAGTELLTHQNELIKEQAKLGIAQETIDGWSVRNQIELDGHNFAKGQLLAIDPYEAATNLEAAQFQLESLYTVTVRLSQLSLVNYLR